LPGGFDHRRRMMTYFVGLDVSQKITAICVVDAAGVRIWRGTSASAPEEIEAAIRSNAGADARIGLETGPMTPWLAHELRGRGLDVECLDARHARAALKMSFGDGAHFCPGWQVALTQTRILLERLFPLPGIRLVQPPQITWVPAMLQMYELRKGVVACNRD
jgi:hypothetical protein